MSLPEPLDTDSPDLADLVHGCLWLRRFMSSWNWRRMQFGIRVTETRKPDFWKCPLNKGPADECQPHTCSKIVATNASWRVLVYLLLAALAQPASGAEQWRYLQAEHYQVLSQLSDRDTLAWASEFNQFVNSMSEVLSINPQHLPSLQVVLFARDQDFAPYKLVGPDGRAANIGGQFVRQQNWSVIGLASTRDSEGLRRTILHEAAHWLTSADSEGQPAWYREGIAELFSTFVQSGDRVRWALPISSHVYALRRNAMPLRELLLQPTAIFDRDDYTDRFYAQAWAFTHFLLYSQDPSLPPLLKRYLELHRSGPADAALEQTFGDRFAAIEQAFGEYLEQRRFTTWSRPAATQDALPSPVPAAQTVVEATLGFLALGAKRHALARQHAERAAQLDPASPSGHEILAYLAREENRQDEVVDHAADAVQRGSRDSEMYVQLGHSFLDGSNSRQPNAALRRVELYAQAVELDRLHPDTYERLAEGLFSLPEPTETHARMLRDGLEAFPANDWIRAGLAVVEFQLGHKDAAQKAMDRALGLRSTLDTSQREFASRTWQELQIQSAVQDLNAARDRRDARAVQRLTRELLARTDLPPDLRANLERLRRQAD